MQLKLTKKCRSGPSERAQTGHTCVVQLDTHSDCPVSGRTAKARRLRIGCHTRPPDRGRSTKLPDPPPNKASSPTTGVFSSQAVRRWSGCSVPPRRAARWRRAGRRPIRRCRERSRRAGCGRHLSGRRDRPFPATSSRLSLRGNTPGPADAGPGRLVNGRSGARIPLRSQPGRQPGHIRRVGIVDHGADLVQPWRQEFDANEALAGRFVQQSLEHRPAAQRRLVLEICEFVRPRRSLVKPWPNNAAGAVRPRPG